MTIVRPAYREKMQEPVEKVVTAYAIRRQALDEKKLFDNEVKKLCNRTGMAPDAAAKALSEGYYDEPEVSATEISGQ